MKRLCIGTNTEDTDIKTSLLAKEHNSTNWGLIDSVDYYPEDVGGIIEN